MQTVNVTTEWDGGQVNQNKTDLYWVDRQAVLSFLKPFCEGGIYAKTVIAKGKTFSAILTYVGGSEIFVYEVTE